MVKMKDVAQRAGVSIATVSNVITGKRTVSPEVQKAVQAVADQLGDTGRILVRESGTEPVVRVMVEAQSQQLCEQYVDHVISVIRSKGHCV